jgi:hypothetical protein
MNSFSTIIANATNGKKVRGDEDLSMPTEELQPGGPPLSPGGGLNPGTFQNRGDGAPAHIVTEVGQRALDPGIAPRAVLRRHPDHALAKFRHDRWSSRTAALAAVVLPCDQRPVCPASRSTEAPPARVDRVCGLSRPGGIVISRTVHVIGAKRRWASGSVVSPQPP